MKIFGINFGKTAPQKNIVAVDQLDPYAMASSQFSLNSDFTGEKFIGGFGPTHLFTLDYWTLRQRSSQLFTENLYARGLIRRLITNEINIGLTPEIMPDEDILGVPEDSLADWSETVENRFAIWSKNPNLCDWSRRSTFGAIQRAARMEALISGDVLVVLRQNQRTKLPAVQLISGNLVQSPLGGSSSLRSGHKITHGVETDANDRIVAHWIKQDGGGSKRLPAFGERSGRRLSWLVYGVEKRLDEVRGTPMLSLILQSLKEVDRYRDSVQRKAVINSILAMFIEKSADKMGTLPVTGGAVRRDQVTVTDSDGGSRNFNLAGQVPGLVMEELQTGEKPHAFRSQGTEESFGVFESAIMQAIAWANEMPPDILTLAFSKSHSASQASINEFKIYLNKIWSDFGETFCSPIQVEVLLSEVLSGKMSAPGLLQAWRNPDEYDIFGAWTVVNWYGSVKPSTDVVKQGKGSKLLIEECLSTHAREARGINGSKFSHNAKTLARENKQKAAAVRPILELEKEFGADNTAAAISALEDATVNLQDAMEDMNVS